VLGEAILRAVAGAEGVKAEAEAWGAAWEVVLLTRTLRSTGAAEWTTVREVWTGREAWTEWTDDGAGPAVENFSLTITSSRRSSYLDATLECSEEWWW
jgi:hypothetical protein